MSTSQNRPEHNPDDPDVDQDAEEASRPTGAADPGNAVPDDVDPDAGPSTQPD